MSAEGALETYHTHNAPKVPHASCPLDGLRGHLPSRVIDAAIGALQPDARPQSPRILAQLPPASHRRLQPRRAGRSPACTRTVSALYQHRRLEPSPCLVKRVTASRDSECWRQVCRLGTKPRRFAAQAPRRRVSGFETAARELRPYGAGSTAQGSKRLLEDAYVVARQHAFSEAIAARAAARIGSAWIGVASSDASATWPRAEAASRDALSARPTLRRWPRGACPG